MIEPAEYIKKKERWRVFNLTEITRLILIILYTCQEICRIHLINCSTSKYYTVGSNIIWPSMFCPYLYEFHKSPFAQLEKHLLFISKKKRNISYLLRRSFLFTNALSICVCSLCPTVLWKITNNFSKHWGLYSVNKSVNRVLIISLY